MYDDKILFIVYKLIKNLEIKHLESEEARINNWWDSFVCFTFKSLSIRGSEFETQKSKLFYSNNKWFLH